jgi:hypothetical protein
LCRNIRRLFNFEPPARQEEIRAAALQFVRKVSGFNKPSALNEAAFNQAVDQIAGTTATLLKSLKTTASARDREVEKTKALDRTGRRFGSTKQ